MCSNIRLTTTWMLFANSIFTICPNVKPITLVDSTKKWHLFAYWNFHICPKVWLLAPFCLVAFSSKCQQTWNKTRLFMPWSLRRYSISFRPWALTWGYSTLFKAHRGTAPLTGTGIQHGSLTDAFGGPWRVHRVLPNSWMAHSMLPNTTLASSLNEELAWKICCSETPLCHWGAPSASHSVLAWAAQGQEELKDSSGISSFPGRERES